MFNAITKQAVTEAMKHPRDIDVALVDAYLARRALDYLVGFTLSPVLWRKLPGARSAGRVQSVALRLVCDRELEIETFVARNTGRSTPRWRRRAAKPSRRAWSAPTARSSQRLDIGTGAEAEAVKAALEGRDLQGRRGRGQAGRAAIRRRPSPPRPCSRRRAASSASRRRNHADRPAAL